MEKRRWHKKTETEYLYSSPGGLCLDCVNSHLTASSFPCGKCFEPKCAMRGSEMVDSKADRVKVQSGNQHGGGDRMQRAVRSARDLLKCCPGFPGGIEKWCCGVCTEPSHSNRGCWGCDVSGQNPTGSTTDIYFHHLMQLTLGPLCKSHQLCSPNPSPKLTPWSLPRNLKTPWRPPLSLPAGVRMPTWINSPSVGDSGY